MKNGKEILFDILKDFLTVRSFITLGAFFTLYSFVWTGREIPSIIAHIVDILLGFWFGTKVAEKMKQNKEAV